MTPSGCHPYAMGLGRICFTPRDLFPPLVVRRVATLAFAPPGGVALLLRCRQAGWPAGLAGPRRTKVGITVKNGPVTSGRPCGSVSSCDRSGTAPHSLNGRVIRARIAIERAVERADMEGR